MKWNYKILKLIKHWIFLYDFVRVSFAAIVGSNIFFFPVGDNGQVNSRDAR